MAAFVNFKRQRIAGKNLTADVVNELVGTGCIIACDREKGGFVTFRLGNE